MEPEEILESIKLIRKESRDLIDIYNDKWVKLEDLRSEYKRLTGIDL